jgi:hypothetical protein
LELLVNKYSVRCSHFTFVSNHSLSGANALTFICKGTRQGCLSYGASSSEAGKEGWHRAKNAAEASDWLLQFRGP